MKLQLDRLDAVGAFFMASAAINGDSSQPVNGYNTPAAMGMRPSPHF